jgi:hypothetical protein
MTLDEHRRKAQLRPWTNRWDWVVIEVEYEDRTMVAGLDPITGEVVWEYVEDNRST